MEKQSLVLLSSEVMISEEAKLHPVFLSVDFLLASDQANQNNEGVTKAFIDDLISRKEMFECLPMYVDMDKLLAGDYDNLTHLYNRLTKKFGTRQFGSLTNFYSETDENGVTSLYAQARFPKRELEACMRLVELYEQGKLCVSFELRYNPEHVVIQDGVKYIDAYEDNALVGMCIVSSPAEVRAVALDLVAQKHDDNSDPIITEGEEPTNRGETEPMEKENITAEVTEENAIAEEAKTQEEAVAEVVEEPAAQTEEAVAEQETPAEEAVAEQEESEAAVAETQEATAETLEHSVDTHESVENWGGNPVHVIEYHERVIESMEEAGNLIAELDRQVAELNEIKSKYDALMAEQHERELAEKRDHAKAFAEKQGLDVNDVAVAEAIANIDYEKIAELTMAEEKPEPAKEEESATVAMASFVNIEIGNDPYGGLLARKSK